MHLTRHSRCAHEQIYIYIIILILSRTIQNRFRIFSLVMAAVSFLLTGPRLCPMSNGVLESKRDAACTISNEGCNLETLVSLPSGGKV